MKQLIIGIVATLIVVFSRVADAATPAQLAEINKPIEQVFDVPGHNKQQVYDSTKIWIAENFRSAKAVIEYENKDEGTLIGNGVIPYPCKSSFECLGKPDWEVRFTMRVDTKDNKFRLTFSNFAITWPSTYSAGISRPGNEVRLSSNKDREKISGALIAFGHQIQATINKAQSKDNW